MSGILKISEAAVLALHAMIYMARYPERRVSTHEIAEAHHASENHLSKVLQRLVHAGYVDSIRGPKGGFALAKKADDVALIELYELFDGPLLMNNCLFGIPVCTNADCLFGPLLGDMNSMVRNYLANTRLRDVTA